MLTKMISTLVPVSLLVILAACGSQTSSATKSGSSVNNGPGPVGDILICESLEGNEANYKFTIRHTAAFNLKQGLLQEGENFTSFDCQESKEELKGVATADQPGALWECNESRDGDTLYHVNVYTQGLSALVLADLTIDQVFPLNSQHKLATMVCHEPGA